MSSGPLFVLKQCRDNKTRVRVWTCGPAEVRGVVTVFLAAFDKVTNVTILFLFIFIVVFISASEPWNPALTDV